MIFLAAAVILTLGVVAYVLFVRPSDVPEVEPESPVAHLLQRKSIIYENLRDLAFEYRLGKLSDEDYQKTKTTLQGELAKVLAGIDGAPQGEPAATPPAKPDPLTCPHCGAKFEKALKFCGECGKPMSPGKEARA